MTKHFAPHLYRPHPFEADPSSGAGNCKCGASDRDSVHVPLEQLLEEARVAVVRENERYWELHRQFKSYRSYFALAILASWAMGFATGGLAEGKKN
jgi:hypothetical protein